MNRIVFIGVMFVSLAMSGCESRNASPVVESEGQETVSEEFLPVTINELTIDASGVELETLLSEWTWAMPEPLRPVLITAMGDVFAQGESRAVYFVDMVEGNIRRVAEDGESFRQLLNDNQFVTDHLFPDRIAEIRSAGLTLQPGQVFSHKVLLVLGGANEIGNFDTIDLSVHVSIHGQVHRQVKDLPEGTPIGEIKIN